ncbi:zinc finger BED domain-containing protein RICESLEEPER 2-like [Arachis hypogaea]|uniref:zinc finger BED domain-containing protein RICESLEEPER 2-like n=1 Tax=Arachis hypogaea TaxID=3818 RepID=UPI003B20CDC4
MSASYPEDVQSSEPGFTSATPSTFESFRSSGQLESMPPPQQQSQPQTQTQTQPPSLPPLPPHSDQNNEGTRSKRRRGKANVANESPNPGQSEEQGTGNTKKPVRPRSWTWEHFKKDDSGPKPRAICKWCGASYAADSHKNGTSNLKSHLLSQCRKFPKDSLDPTQKTLVMQQLKKEEGNGLGNCLTSVSFDPDLCRQALARMIIIDELPFRFVEGEGFRYFMSVLQPKLHIPGRISVARDCWNLFMNEKHKLKSVFVNSNQSVCLTTDCWTSVQNLNYLCLTAHFIDQDWKLQKRILNFCLIKNHKGETIGRKIEKCLLNWGISRVFSITVDNASSNDVAICYLKGRMEDWNSHPLKGEHLHVRCCAHILNLVVNDGLKDMHSSISKIRNAVRYVRASPSRMDRFKSCIKEARIQDCSCVQLDVPTRWNSTYIMLDSALKFQKAFKRLSERDAEFVMMQGGIPKNEDWDNARCFVRFLKIFSDVTKKVSGSTFVTSSSYFHHFCSILSSLKTWADSNDILLKGMATKMKAKHDKYWGNLRNMNMMIFVAVVLDPRYKIKFVEWSFQRLFEKEDADFLCGKVKEVFNDLFNSYRVALNSDQAHQSAQHSQDVDMDDSAFDDVRFAAAFENDVQASESVNTNEVDLYLMESLEKPVDPSSFDILTWWKVSSNNYKYPVLSQIARDILAMPVSTVASESAFSTGGRVLNQYRSSLTPKTVEALICAQNWFRANSLPIDLEESFEEFEKLEKELEPIPQLIDEEGSGDESD